MGATVPGAAMPGAPPPRVYILCDRKGVCLLPDNVLYCCCCCCCYCCCSNSWSVRPPSPQQRLSDAGGPTSLLQMRPLTGHQASMSDIMLWLECVGNIHSVHLVRRLALQYEAQPAELFPDRLPAPGCPCTSNRATPTAGATHWQGPLAAQQSCTPGASGAAVHLLQCIGAVHIRHWCKCDTVDMAAALPVESCRNR
jgi:hypothetical protein